MTALVLGIVGTATGTIALVWNVTHYFLTGPRGRVTTIAWASIVGTPGVGQPWLRVRTANVGRVPISIVGASVQGRSGWELDLSESVVVEGHPSTLPTAVQPGFDGELWAPYLDICKEADASRAPDDDDIRVRLVLATGRLLKSKWTTLHPGEEFARQLRASERQKPRD